MARIVNRSALIVGIERYRHLDPIAGPQNDAKAVDALLSGPGQMRTRSLRGVEMSTAELSAVFEEFLSGLNAEDGAVIFFAGHGELDVDGHLRLMPSDSRRAIQGVPVSRLFEWGAKAGALVVVLDCSNAGAIPAKALTLGHQGSRLALCASTAGRPAYADGAHGTLTRALLDAAKGHERLSAFALLSAAADGCRQRHQAPVLLARGGDDFDLISAPAADGHPDPPALDAAEVYRRTLSSSPPEDRPVVSAPASKGSVPQPSSRVLTFEYPHLQVTVGHRLGVDASFDLIVVPANGRGSRGALNTAILEACGLSPDDVLPSARAGLTADGFGLVTTEPTVLMIRTIGPSNARDMLERNLTRAVVKHRDALVGRSVYFPTMGTGQGGLSSAESGRIIARVLRQQFIEKRGRRRTRVFLSTSDPVEPVVWSESLGVAWGAGDVLKVARRAYGQNQVTTEALLLGLVVTQQDDAQLWSQLRVDPRALESRLKEELGWREDSGADTRGEWTRRARRVLTAAQAAGSDIGVIRSTELVQGLLAVPDGVWRMKVVEMADGDIDWTAIASSGGRSSTTSRLESLAGTPARQEALTSAPLGNPDLASTGDLPQSAEAPSPDPPMPPPPNDRSDAFPSGGRSLHQGGAQAPVEGDGDLSGGNRARPDGVDRAEPDGVDRAAPDGGEEPAPPSDACLRLLIGARAQGLYRGETKIWSSRRSLDFAAHRFPGSLTVDQVRRALGYGRLRVDGQTQTWGKSEALAVGKSLAKLACGGHLRATAEQVDRLDGITRLAFELDDAAAQLPWEYLAIGTQHLVERRLSMVRIVDAPPKPLSLNGPPRVALVSAQPSTEDEHDNIDEAEHRQPIAEALCRVGGSADDIASCTVKRLMKTASRADFDVLHFIGHGTIDGLDVKSADAKHSGPVGARKLTLGLADGSARLVFLGACESGAADTSSAVGRRGLARAITEGTGIPVVAMQLVVPQDYSTQFGATFYELLRGQDWHIERAVYHARRRLIESGRGLLFGIPVLWIARGAPNITPADIAAAERPTDYRFVHYVEARHADVQVWADRLESTRGAVGEADVFEQLQNVPIPLPTPRPGVVTPIAELAGIAPPDPRRSPEPQTNEDIVDFVNDPPGRIEGLDRSELRLTPEQVSRVVDEVLKELVLPRALVLRVLGELSAGRHVMLVGPVGTGKTTLARALIHALGYRFNLETAHGEWSTSDVIGGIWPGATMTEDGRRVETIHFRPGCFLEAVCQNWAVVRTADGERPVGGEDIRLWKRVSAEGQGTWLVIDELNRADIDRAMGGLFTALETRSLRVPLMTTRRGRASIEVPIPNDFRIIATMNHTDRHALFQLSNALKRRFAFIDVPLAPEDAEWKRLCPEGDADAVKADVRRLVHHVRRAGYPVGTALLKTALAYVETTRGWPMLDEVRLAQAIEGSVLPGLEDADDGVLLAALNWVRERPTGSTDAGAAESVSSQPAADDDIDGAPTDTDGAVAPAYRRHTRGSLEALDARLSGWLRERGAESP